MLYKRLDITPVLVFNMVICMEFESMNVALRGQCVKPLHQQTINNTLFQRTLLFYHNYGDLSSASSDFFKTFPAELLEKIP